jgi:glycosyltransferase involved in cell wall biosynthesis
MINISIVTPLGPHEHNQRWLKESIASVRLQSVQPFDYLVVGNVDEMGSSSWAQPRLIPCDPPTIANNTNTGVEEARSDWIFVLNSDDKLGQYCIEWIQKKIQYILDTEGNEPFFLRFPYFLSKYKEVVRNGHCFHKDVWEAVGRYTASWAHDIDFVSALQQSGHKIFDTDWGGEIGDPKEYYYYRQHLDQHSKPRSTYTMPEDSPDIAIIVIAGLFSNKDRWLQECIQSVQEQTVPASEFVIVDNKRELDNVEGATIVHANEVENKADLYNKGVAKIKSDWILLLKPDDRLGANCIEWIKIKISQLIEFTGEEHFFLRFPIAIGDTEEYFVSGTCFHRQIWETLNGFWDINIPEEQFLSAVFRNKHFQVYDANWQGMIGNPYDYYIHNIYPEPPRPPDPIIIDDVVYENEMLASMREVAFQNIENISMSIITPVGPNPWNKRWLDDCVQSVRNQTYAPKEHILVADGTPLRNMKGTKVLRLKENMGHPYAYNYGIMHSTGEWIAILNSDDVLGPRCVEWLCAKINFLSAKTNKFVFFLRFPIVRDIDGELILNGLCFHRAVWERVKGFPTDNSPPDVYFISRVLQDGFYPLFDSNWIVEFGDPREYYIHRIHPDQLTSRQE